MRFSSLIAVLMALTFVVGISQCAMLCIGAENSANQDAPPCHDMGHTSKSNHSSCPRLLLVAEQAASVQTHSIAPDIQSVRAFKLDFIALPSFLVITKMLVQYPPRPPLLTAVLLI